MPYLHHRAFFRLVSLSFQMPRMPYRVTQMAVCAGSSARRALKPHPTPNRTAPPAYIIPAPSTTSRSLCHSPAATGQLLGKASWQQGQTAWEPLPLLAHPACSYLALELGRLWDGRFGLKGESLCNDDDNTSCIIVTAVVDGERKRNKTKTDQEASDLVEDVCCHCRGIGLDGLQKSVAIQTIL